ncbi:hypothetical protein [Rhodococcus sp. NPDC127528]|uniref:hypothetical protein n=1 Tax=unclassified Rhodococcus (in: high G+C Gram-positive bacteria) TaxID=192944 RepID=UPI00362A0D7D
MRLVPDLPADDDRADGDDDEYAMTPRQMRITAIVARTLADSAYDDIVTHTDTPVTADAYWAVFADYPAATWHQSAQWRRHAARAFDDLASDIETGNQPHPTCTGEEMALHLILERAAALHGDGHFDDQLHDLPAHPDDTDWASPLDYLFQDHDVLVLFEDKTLDDAVNLDPADWFTPFELPRARDHHRGFRR